MKFVYLMFVSLLLMIGCNQPQPQDFYQRVGKIDDIDINTTYYIIILEDSSKIIIHDSDISGTPSTGSILYKRIRPSIMYCQYKIRNN